MREHEDLLEKAKAVLEKNWNGKFTKPAPNLYPHQWNWDTGFIAIGQSHFNPERAEAELRHLFSAQWSTGMVPQIVFGEEKNARYFPGPDFWQTYGLAMLPEGMRTSGITMPPVHGFVLWMYYEAHPDPEKAIDFLRELFPKVLHLHRYLYEYRDPNKEGLVYVRHPWEPGTDNSPTWDVVLESMQIDKSKLPPYQRKDLQNLEAALHRPTDTDYDRYVYLVDLFRKHRYDDLAIEKDCPFKIQDPLFNGILCWSNECLIKIGQLLGEQVDELVRWNEMTIFSMNHKLWDAEVGTYHAYDLTKQQIIPCFTSSGLLPMVGMVPTQEQAERILQRIQHEDFSGKSDQPAFRLPTYQLDGPVFDPAKYWRGPIWINMNWLLYQGLKRYDMFEAAEKVRSDSLELIRKYGFFEYFDPYRNADTAKGYGTDQFSWTAALCIDFICRD